MKKIVLLAVLVLSTLSMAMASKDSRGVLLMSEEEWMNFYNQPGNDIPLCAIIGSLKMEEGYIKDARFRNYEDLKNILREYFLIYEDLKTEVLIVDWNEEDMKDSE